MLIAWIAEGSRSSNSSRERAYAMRPREGGLRRRELSLSLSLSLSHRVPARDGDNEDQNVRIQETTAVEYLYAYLW